MLYGRVCGLGLLGGSLESRDPTQQLRSVGKLNFILLLCVARWIDGEEKNDGEDCSRNRHDGPSTRKSAHGCYLRFCESIRGVYFKSSSM